MAKYTESQKQEALRLLKLGKPQKEISELTGIKVNTIKILKHNAAISSQTVNGSDAKEKIEDAENNNERVIDSKSKRIKTLDDLIAACEIDLEVWNVDKWVANKWEVGINSDGEIETSPLFQVKAWLSKKHPEPIEPVISTININVGNFRKVRSEKREYKKGLLLFDTQIGFEQNMRSKSLAPFHDRKAIDIAFQFCCQQSFDLIVMGGDWQDNAMWSDKFIRKPSYYFNTQSALCENSWICGMLRKMQPNADMIYFEGNHEKRPEDMIMKHLLPAYGLRSADNVDGLAVMSMPSLLGLPSLNIKYIGNYPETEYWINDKVVVRHGNIARKGSGATAAAIAKEGTYTEIFGHIHRFEWAIRTEHRNGKTNYIQAFSPGCLCRIDGKVPGFDARPNWQQGFAVIHYNDDECHIDPVMIKDGEAYYQGKKYVGLDYTEQLIKDTAHHDKEGNLIKWNY